MAVFELPFESFSHELANTSEAEDEHEIRYEPELVSRRLTETVALIRHAGLRFQAISSGRAVVVLPFRQELTNQNSSLQASVLHMAADFAAGVALGAALPGTYVLGMHDPCRAMPIQFWTAKTMIKYHRPVEGDARIVATLTEDAIPRLRKQMRSAGRCTVDIEATVFVGKQKAMSTTQTILAIAAPWRRLGDRLTRVSEGIERSNALALGGLASSRVRDVLPRAVALADRIVNLAPLLEEITKATGDDEPTDQSILRTIVRIPAMNRSKCLHG